MTANSRSLSGFDSELGIGFSLRYDNRKSACRHACAGIADDPAADRWVPPGQQCVGDDFLQPPAPCDGQQMLLTLCLRDFDKIFRA